MSSSTAVPASNAENVINTTTATVPTKRTLTQILADLKTFLDVGRALYNELKPYEKEFTKIQKKMDQDAAKKEKQKQTKKEKAPAVERLYHISPLFAEFKNVPATTTMTRKNVLQAIYDYLKENKLQNPLKKTEYVLDMKLKKLFTGTVDEGKTYILSKEIMSQYHKHILAPADASTPAPVSASVPTPTTKVESSANDDESDDEEESADEESADEESEEEAPVPISQPPKPVSKPTAATQAPKPAIATATSATKPATPTVPVVKKVVAAGKK
jgi:hypothetical protein